MAQRIITQLIDDTTGEEIAPGEGERVTFALDDTSYALDLTRKNAEEFRKLLDDYIAVAEKSGRGRPKAATRRSASKNTSEVRTWARANGWPDLGDRGRIPADAQAAFEAT